MRASSTFRRVWQSKELWDRVDGEARFPLEAAITLSALPADKRNAFLQDLDSRQPKPKTAEIMQLAREWQGSSVTGRLKVSDVASNATAVFEHFVHGSPGVNALDIEVAYEKEVKAPTMRLVLPLQENGNDAARELLARGSTLAGDVPPLATPSNSPAPPAPAAN